MKANYLQISGTQKAAGRMTWQTIGLPRARLGAATWRRWAVASLALLASPGGLLAQTNVANTTAASSANAPASSTNVIQLAPTTVYGQLDVARNQIMPDLGATVFNFSKEQINALPSGENAPFNEIILHAPGVAQDSAANGDLHLRGEHANIQYRINDVLLPEGITGFGLELDTRFVDSMRLITGSLPAQYGFRTAGVVDIHTKSGALDSGGEVSMYGGSYDTYKPSVEYGGSKGKWSWFVDGSDLHDDIGIENPTPSAHPIHDTTDQFKTFADLSYLIDDTSRISFIGSVSYSDYQVPDTANLPPGAPSVATNVTAVPWYAAIPNLPAHATNSADLNERQNEQNYYAVVAYQKSAGNFNFQVAPFLRDSSVHFRPDSAGDLVFNGVASDVNRTLYSGGLQADASYALGDKHTIRSGVMIIDESLSAHSTTSAFVLDANGNPAAQTNIVDNSVGHAIFAGIYLQDEWKVLPQVTINYGARFDVFYASFDHENQPSPRVNIIWTPTDSTTLHVGYARYFTPPPLENVPSTTVHKFDGTSNASATDQDDPVKAERANYFDVGANQELAPGLQVGLDGYYKAARNQLDDGLFGQTLILSAFNYAYGEVYGLEFTASYVHEGFSTYANLAYSVAKGKDWSSAQFLHDPVDAAYVKNNWIYLDHDQEVSGSFGASYLWKHTCGSTRFYVDAIYGSGLRTDGFLPDGTKVPNGGTVPAYYSVGLGVEEAVKIRGKEHLKARLDVVNVTDNTYELRNGSGVGVNAAQFGMRLGFFGTLSYMF